MKRGNRTGKTNGELLRRVLGVGAAVTALALCLTLDARADDTLSCYKGDKDNSVYIGDVAGADLKNAAGECNAFYADCNGECFGCYLDEDSSTEVCVDSQGNKFPR